MDVAITPSEITPDTINNVLKAISDFLDLAEKITMFTLSKADDEIVAKAKLVLAWIKELVAKPWFASVVEFILGLLNKKAAA